MAYGKGRERTLDVSSQRVPPGTPANGDFTYSVIEVGPHERRREHRHRTRLRVGRVAEQRGRVVVDCRIRDMSRDGARLHLEADRPLPRTFLLTDGGSRTRFWATLVWQSGQDAGVRLIRAVEPVAAARLR